MKELNLGGAVVQAYPLTAAQRVHYYTVNACNRKELLNICTGFYLQYDQVDFDVLKECIYQGYEKYEAMRLRFHTDEEGQLYQYLVPTEDRDIPVGANLLISCPINYFKKYLFSIYLEKMLRGM